MEPTAIILAAGVIAKEIAFLLNLQSKLADVDMILAIAQQVANLAEAWKQLTENPDVTDEQRHAARAEREAAFKAWKEA